MVRLAIRISIYTVVCASLLACSSLPQGDGDANPRLRPDIKRGKLYVEDDLSNSREQPGLRDLILGGRDGGGNENTLPVNKYLWRASLDTLSFLPLASTDPFSGVVATEWGASPESPNERVRVTAYVEGKELTARALDVSVFRETLNASGAWVAAPVNPNTAEQVKDKILLRARELRIEDVDGPRA